MQRVYIYIIYNEEELRYVSRFACDRSMSSTRCMHWLPMVAPLHYARIGTTTAPTRNAELGLYNKKKLDMATESELWECIIQSGKKRS